MKKIGSVLFMVFALSCGLFLHMDSAKASVQPAITPLEVVTGSENVMAKKNQLSCTGTWKHRCSRQGHKTGGSVCPY